MFIYKTLYLVGGHKMKINFITILTDAIEYAVANSHKRVISQVQTLAIQLSILMWMVYQSLDSGIIKCADVKFVDNGGDGVFRAVADSSNVDQYRFSDYRVPASMIPIFKACRVAMNAQCANVNRWAVQPNVDIQTWVEDVLIGSDSKQGVFRVTPYELERTYRAMEYAGMHWDLAPLPDPSEMFTTVNEWEAINVGEGEFCAVIGEGSLPDGLSRMWQHDGSALLNVGYPKQESDSKARFRAWIGKTLGTSYVDPRNGRQSKMETVTTSKTEESM
jgi:hypothetical protein